MSGIGSADFLVQSYISLTERIIVRVTSETFIVHNQSNNGVSPVSREVA